jgi:cupin 2 domain-containing protein
MPHKLTDMKNIFDAIPGNIDTEIIERIIDCENVKIERIISKGHTSPDTGWYDQAENEWVLVLKGEAVLQFADGSTLPMKAGDHINIAAHKKHRVQWTDPDTETIWLAVFY